MCVVVVEEIHKESQKGPIDLLKKREIEAWKHEDLQKTWFITVLSSLK